MVEVPDLGDGFHAMWHELLYLARNPPAPWTLIGAHMVALHGWRMGRKQPRASKDADILVNVGVVSHGTERVSERLLSRGFSLDGVSPEGIGHRFVNEQVRFDVLGPDGVGAHTALFTSSGARTVGVPGGSQALQRTEMVEIRAGDISGMVPVPNLLGSILVKVRAIAVDEQPEAQRGDVAFLLSLVDDPDPLGREAVRAQRGRNPRSTRPARLTPWQSRRLWGLPSGRGTPMSAACPKAGAQLSAGAWGQAAAFRRGCPPGR